MPYVLLLGMRKRETIESTCSLYRHRACEKEKSSEPHAINADARHAEARNYRIYMLPIQMQGM